MTDVQPDDGPGVESQAAYVAVDAIEYAPVAGGARAFCKRLLDSAFLEIRQTRLVGVGGAQVLGVWDTRRLVYVLRGRGTIGLDDGDVALEVGDLVVVPAGVSWGEQLAIDSEELILLEIASRSGPNRADVTPDSSGPLRVVKPREMEPYKPAGHQKTINRCLFIDDQIEVIEGHIEVGGGADRHAHERNEQALYLLNSPQPLLIHYPRRTPHGTGGGIAEPLHLLVIYAPPLGESQNALG